jgi:CRISPR/Cas system-associated exonuclease Cas4 (RecB family)
MLEIMTIRDFMNLPVQQQEEIQKALKVRDRLDQWMEGLNGKRPALLQAEWKPCRSCDPANPGWLLYKPRNDSDIHPSQIHKCIKKLWFDCSGFTQYGEEFIEARLRRTFDLGHAWHHTVQGYGRSGAWGPKQYYRDEVDIDPDLLDASGNPVLPVAHDLWIRGSTDAIIDRYILPNVPTLGDVAVRLVHEYKTINSNGFANLKRPKPEHKWQSMIYSAVYDIPLVCVLYLNKDTSAQIDYPLPFDVVLWRQIEEKIRTVQYYVQNDQMPPWEITSAVKNPTECKNCGYEKICKPERK